jgi:menaquinone-dependent protoporphyrinogen oxidase
MKTLVLYATKRGAAREIAERIARALECAAYDLGGGDIPPLEGYDAVVIGGSLYAGMVRKEAKAFAAQNEAALLGKKVGLFLSGLGKGSEEAFQTNFPKAIVEGAKAKGSMGGIYDPAKCGFGERLIMRLLGKRQYTNTISDEAIGVFVKEMGP